MTRNREPLDVASIRRAVGQADIGRDLRFYAEADSTNRMLHDLPFDRWRHGTVIITDYQNSGRGRGRRRWHAPEQSSVLLSIGLSWPPPVPLASATMVAGLAAGDTINVVTGLSTSLKWPNDVMIGDKKVAGILCDGLVSNGDRRVILGIGMNVNFEPSADGQFPSTATTLMVEAGHMVSREQLTSQLLRSINSWYEKAITNPNAVFDIWRQRLSTLGCEVTVSDGSEGWHGRALDVNNDGGIIVARGDGSLETVYAASISLREHPGSSNP